MKGSGQHRIGRLDPRRRRRRLDRIYDRYIEIDHLGLDGPERDAAIERFVRDLDRWRCER